MIADDLHRLAERGPRRDPAAVVGAALSAATGADGRARQHRRLALVAGVLALVAGGVAIVATRAGDVTDPPMATPPAPTGTGTEPLVERSVPSTSAAAAPPSTSVAGPPPSDATTSTTSTPSTSPSTIVDGVAAPPADACWNAPLPPPSLADGSAVGEAVLDDTRQRPDAVWGEGYAAITQQLGVEPMAPGAPGFSVERGQVVIRYGQGGDRRTALTISGLPNGCSVTYLTQATISWSGAHLLAEAWARALGEGVAINPPTHHELSAPVPYVVRRVVRNDASVYEVELRQVDRDGRDLGVFDGAMADLGALEAFPVDAGGGLRLGLAEGDRYCTGAPVLAADGATPVDAFGSATSIAGSAAGVVVVGREMCGDGESWGAPGSLGELVRHDLRAPDRPSMVVWRAEPFPEHPFGGLARAVDVDPTGRYLALWESTNLEQGRYHVVDMDAGGAPLDFESSCDDAGDIVGTPRFVDGAVAVARHCGGEAFELVVDVVDLDDGRLRWGQIAAGGRSDSYGGTIDGVSATVVDGDVWVIATSGGFELPGRAVLLADGAQTDITRLGDVTAYVFGLRDLVVR